MESPLKDNPSGGPMGGLSTTAAFSIVFAIGSMIFMLIEVFSARAE